MTKQSHSSTPQQRLKALERALRPFAKFEKAGWAESHWEGKPDEYVVMVRYKNQKMTKTTITLGDFRIALKTYEECK